MENRDLKDRTKKIAVRIVEFTDTLPNNKTKFNVISKQLIRCSTSVAANYRAACRGKSKADFIAKLGIVEEEADETLFWLEFIVELDKSYRDSIVPLYKEMNEVLAIIVASKKTARKNNVK